MTAPVSVSLNDAIARIALADRAAFRQVYAASSSRLFAVCLRLMRNREEAEDVLQEAFVKVWERSHLYDAKKGEALAWLITIARHCALDRLRRPGRNAAPFDETAAAEWDRQTLHEAEQPAASGALQRCLGDCGRSTAMSWSWPMSMASPTRSWRHGSASRWARSKVALINQGY